MLLLSCRNIKKEFAGLEVLKDVNFDLMVGERVGLVGRNGAGKTTLANIVFGKLKPDKGSVIKHKDYLKIGYLLQSTSYNENTFNEMVTDLFAGEFFKLTSYLGLKDVQEWDSGRIEGLSGGEKTKLALAKVWSSKPDILILDEPTNHLDFQGTEWLINKLKDFSGATIIISHDRYFLDQVVSQIMELEDGIIHNYNGNYSFYRQEKKRKYEIKLHHYQEQKKEERKIEAQIKRLDRWASKGNREARKKAIKNGMKFGGKEFYRAKAKKLDKQVKSRKKRLMKLKEEGIERPPEEPEVNFDFASPAKKGRRVIEAKRITKGFGRKILFENSSFYIQHGDRIGVIGPNGCGKTTLLKLILRQEEVDNGELWVSPSTRLGYLSQDVHNLNPEKTVNETIDALQEYYNEEARSLLVNMGFTDEMLAKPIGKLSLGERTRVKLADLVLKEKDCLLLDEPTNHLDLYSREELEDTLEQYQGTVLLVSHDRYLLEKICKQLLIFEKGSIKRLEMGFKEYLKRQNTNVEEKQEDQQEKKILIENRIAYLLGELEKYTPEDEEYQRLDQEFQQLIEKKRKLNNYKS